MRQGSPTPTGSRIPPPNPSPTRIGPSGREREGRHPLLLVLIGLGKGGRCGQHLGPLSSFPLRPIKAHIPPGGSDNPPGTPVKFPISPGVIPEVKYRLPIYQSLCLDHFETPRHVRDLIRDSEQPSVHQHHKTHSNCHRNVKRADPTGSRTM